MPENSSLEKITEHNWTYTEITELFKRILMLQRIDRSKKEIDKNWILSASSTWICNCLQALVNWLIWHIWFIQRFKIWKLKYMHEQCWSIWTKKVPTSRKMELALLANIFLIDHHISGLSYGLKVLTFSLSLLQPDPDSSWKHALILTKIYGKLYTSSAVDTIQVEQGKFHQK